MKRTCFSLVASAAFAGLLFGPSPVLAQTAPSLGTAQSFAVLGGSTVTAAGGGATITGDVGVSPGTSITGPVTVVSPFNIHNNDGSAIAAQSSVTALYTSLAGTGGATALSAELGGLSLTPGTYSFTSTANIAANQTLTLTGGGTFVFLVGSAITANVGSSVVLANGASACNVFWQVTSAATLNGNSFAGTVVAQAGVTLGVGAALSGRALTTALGAVTLSGGNTVGGCSAAGVGCPTITLAPPTLPAGKVGVTYSQQITASGGTGTYSFSVASGTLPAGLTLTGGLLSGTPTTAGSSPVTIRATDGNECPAVIPYTIVIVPVITLAPATLPNGTVGVAYSQTIVGSGGTAPYTFSVTVGALPAGVTLTAAGVLAGTPTTAGQFIATIRGTDENGYFKELSYTVVISSPVPTLPQWSALLLAAGLLSLGYLRLRRRSAGTARIS